MATVVSDSFIDTDGNNLNTHAPEGAGDAWIAHPVYNSRLEIGTLFGAQGVVASSEVATYGLYYNAVNLADGDQTVTAGIIQNYPHVSPSNIAVCARVDTAAATFYCLLYDNDASGLFLFKFVAGSATNLGSAYYAGSFPISISLSVIGTTITGTYDAGSGVVTVASVTDSDIAGPGKVGILGYGPSGFVMDWFVADGTEGTPPPTVDTRSDGKIIFRAA